MTDESFNPADKFIKIQGGALYLQVKDRLIWARHEHPDLSIFTTLIRLDDTIAVFKADVSYRLPGDGEYTVQATGHGSETPDGFPAYIEKAETIAIGRALGALGYGTAAAFEEAPDGKMADAPVSRAAQTTPQQRNGGTQQRGNNAQQAAAQRTGASGPSEAQIRFLHVLAKENGLDHDGLNAQVNARFSKSSVTELTGGNGGEASILIERLKAKDLVDGVPVAGERIDPAEANQRDGFMGTGLEEPAFLRNAPDPWA